ncbi:hypothetical protein [Paenibacillus sp. IHBB 3054]|uniref:hypothetical protein n=1 Tax=Paenibacillus sp. IHBB 3054 TaxID=3425689 RepID=UPI003F67CD43
MMVLKISSKKNEKDSISINLNIQIGITDTLPLAGYFYIKSEQRYFLVFGGDQMHIGQIVEIVYLENGQNHAA